MSGKMSSFAIALVVMPAAGIVPAPPAASGR